MVEINNSFAVIHDKVDRSRAVENRDDFSRWLSNDTTTGQDSNNQPEAIIVNKAIANKKYTADEELVAKESLVSEINVPNNEFTSEDTLVNEFTSEDTLVNEFTSKDTLVNEKTIDNEIFISNAMPTTNDNQSSLVKGYYADPRLVSETIALWMQGQHVNNSSEDENGAVNVRWQSVGSFQVQLSPSDQNDTMKVRFMIFNHQLQQPLYNEPIAKVKTLNQSLSADLAQLPFSSMSSTVLIGRTFNNTKVSKINMGMFNSISEPMKVRSSKLTESKGKLTLWVRDYFTEHNTNAEQVTFSLTKKSIDKLVINGVTQWDKK
jgi:hypothetical protein